MDSSPDFPRKSFFLTKKGKKRKNFSCWNPRRAEKTESIPVFFLAV
jgi:hypothetical protein